MVISRIRKYSIYRIVSPSNRIYIGQSINIDRRLKDYQCLYKSKGQTILHNSFLKYGIDNHKFTIIYDKCLNKQEADTKEEEFIKLYKVLNISLNIRDSVNSGNCSLEKSIIQFDLEGNFLNEFKSVTQAQFETGISASNISNAICSKKAYSGKFLWLSSEDYSNNLTPFWKNKGKSKFKKPVNKFDLSGNYICSYSTVTEAAKTNLVSSTEIFSNLKGTTKRVDNFIYSEDSFAEPYINDKIRYIFQFNLQGDFIKKYSSAEEYSKQNKINIRTVRTACLRESIVSNEFILSYYSFVKPYSSFRGKWIYQYNSEGVLINTFKTIKEAREKLNLSTSTIRSKLNSKIKKYNYTKNEYTLSYGEFKGQIQNYKRLRNN